MAKHFWRDSCYCQLFKDIKITPLIRTLFKLFTIPLAFFISLFLILKTVFLKTVILKTVLILKAVNDFSFVAKQLLPRSFYKGDFLIW